MREVNNMPEHKHRDVEEVILPMRYRKPAAAHTFHHLALLYDNLRAELLLTLQRLDDVSRGQWHAERQLETQVAVNDAMRNENIRLSEAGRYAVYGKKKAEEEEFSTFDEEGAEEQDGGEEESIK